MIKVIVLMPIGTGIKNHAIYQGALREKCQELLAGVYKLYCGWCRANNYKPAGKKNFREKLSEKVDITPYIGQDHVIGVSQKEGLPLEWKV